jgi:hypothetical protein
LFMPAGNHEVMHTYIGFVGAGEPAHCSPKFSVRSSSTPTWEEKDCALSFSDLEQDRVLGRSNRGWPRKLL